MVESETDGWRRFNMVESESETDNQIIQFRGEKVGWETNILTFH